jgi:hypothetical protein
MLTALMDAAPEEMENVTILVCLDTFWSLLETLTRVQVAKYCFHILYCDQNDE